MGKAVFITASQTEDLTEEDRAVKHNGLIAKLMLEHHNMRKDQNLVTQNEANEIYKYKKANSKSFKSKLQKPIHRNASTFLLSQNSSNADLLLKDSRI